MLESEEVSIRASADLERLGINDKVDLELTCIFMWSDAPQPSLSCVADMDMWLDPPGAFAFLPRGAVKAAGDAALATTLRLLMGAFVRNMATDYERWSTDPEFRSLRRSELEIVIGRPEARETRVPTIDSQEWD